MSKLLQFMCKLKNMMSLNPVVVNIL